MADEEKRVRPSSRDEAQPSRKNPPAGPHAKPELIDEERTPRSGVLPRPDEPEIDAPTG